MPCRADFGWIPDYQKLVLKPGYEFFTTSSNFAGDGAIDNIVFKNESNISLTEHRFFIDGEYGLAEDWSGLLKLGFATGFADSDTGTIAEAFL